MNTSLHPYSIIDFSEFFQAFYRLKNLVEPRNHRVTETNALDDDSLEDTGESGESGDFEEGIKE